MNTIKTAAVKKAEAILRNGLAETYTSMETVLDLHFKVARLSDVEAAYESDLMTQGPDSENLSLVSAIKAYKDVLVTLLEEVSTLERFVALSIPKMEDGNNFGVTVQLMVSKLLKETKENLLKKLESVPTYFSSRAEAIDKLNLPKSVTSETKTVSNAESTGGKDGDEKKSSVSMVTEEKNTYESKKGSTNYRIKHLISIDVQMYSTLRSGMVDSMNVYLTLLDTMEKNKEKLLAPKGSSGGNSMGMY